MVGMYDYWSRQRELEFHPEEIENKEKAREEIKELVDQYLKEGGQIKVYGVTGSDTITRKEIKEEYGVTDTELNQWIKSRLFPMKLKVSKPTKKGRSKEAKDQDRYFLSEVRSFFRNDLGNKFGYERYMIVSPRQKLRFDR